MSSIAGNERIMADALRMRDFEINCWGFSPERATRNSAYWALADAVGREEISFRGDVDSSRHDAVIAEITELVKKLTV